MAEPLSNSDKINRDYLASDPERELTEADVPELMGPERELRSSGYEDSEYERSDYERYESTSRRQNPRLNDTAEAIGNAVGNAARRVQEMKDRFTVISGRTRASASSAAYDWKQATDEKMQEARERATQAFEEVRLKANDTLQDAKDRASRALGDVRQNASEKLNRARMRASRVADERPLQIILGIGAAAFLVGILLRVGRSNNA